MNPPAAPTPGRERQPGDNLLVLLAHNDDEFFISPLLGRELAAGTRVWVAYLTHGSVYGADSGQRIAESGRVLAELGLPPEQVLLVGAQADIFDGSLAFHLDRAYQGVLTALASIPVDRIWTLAWEGGHPDHDAANVIGTALAKRLSCMASEFPAYNARGLPGGLFRVMVFAEDSRAAQVTRLSLLEGFAALLRAARFRSQRRTFLGLAPGAALELLWHRRQKLRPIPPDRDYDHRPHAGPLFYERRFGTTFEEFRIQSRSFLTAASVRAPRTATPPSASYRTQALGVGAEEIRLTAELLRRVWPHSRQFSADYLRWLYVDNPAGSAIGVNAWCGDELVGHYALIPIEVQLRDKQVRATLSLNTAVHPSHQGRGLFVRLAEDTYQTARAAGIHHVVGVANANSTPGFLGRLGFTHLGTLDAKLIWGPTGWSDQRQEITDWQRRWTPESYRWRISNPAASYRVARAGGRLLCLAPTGKFGIQAILRVEEDAGFRALLESSLPAAPTAPVKLWIGLAPRLRVSLLAGGSIPMRLRRSPLNLIYRSLSGDAFMPSPGRLEFSLMDFDAY